MFKLHIDNWKIIILLFLFFILSLMRFLAIIPILQSNILFVMLGSLSLIYCIVQKGLVYQKSFLFFLFMYSLFGIVSGLYNGNLDIQELFWPFGFMSIGLLSLNFKLPSTFLKYLYLGYCIIIFILIMTSGNVDSFKHASSRNTISSDVVLYFSLYVIAAYQNCKTISMFYPFTGFLLCIMATGRSGILTGCLLVFFFMVFDFRDGKAKMRKSSLLLAGFLLIIFLGILNYFFNDYVESAIMNFQWRQLESARTFIWKDYLTKMFSSLLNIFFGASISGTYYLNLYNENLHNSFLMLHAKYGMFGVLLILFLLIQTFIKLSKEKNVFLLMPLFLVLFRMNFDYTNFNSGLDTILIFYLLYPYYKCNIISKTYI